MIINFIKDNKKSLLIILGVLLVLSIITIFINKGNKYKIYPSESYVYTKEEYKNEFGLVSRLPYINIKGDDVNDINIVLINKYYEVNAINDYFMDYDYYESDNILSLVVNTHSNSSPDAYPRNIYIYNIDINNGSVISNNQLFKIFNVSSDQVSESVRNGIKDYYDYELSKGYADSSLCDFDCYLSGSNSLPILDNCSYYVKNNTLYAHKIISLNSKFFYDTTSGFELFNFKIKEK